MVNILPDGAPTDHHAVLASSVRRAARSGGHKGAASELIVCAELLARGYEVFRNTAPHGPADLIAWDQETGETYLIDVKSTGYHTPKRGEKRLILPRLKDRQVELGVRAVFVTEDGEVFDAAPEDPAPKFRDPSRDWLLVQSVFPQFAQKV